MVILVSDDRSLLRELNQGSREALRRIYRKYRRELFTIAASLLGDRDLAEDCLQDAFVRLADSAGRLRVKTNLKAYLATCVVNRARDRMRRERTRVGCPVEQIGCSIVTPSPAQQLIDDEQVAALLNAMGQLPGEQREAFVLHAQAGLAFREIAALQAVSVRTVHSRYRYAVEKLRGLLREGTER